ncbi:MAG: methyltransferase [Gammaproteobacteria bacterium]|nr:methyltransferase [Gammaproteobacteria bacterium]
MYKYKLKYETVTVNDIEYQIRSLKDNQQYNDDDSLAEDLGISSATWPLFGILWPAAQVLANIVSVIELEGKRVLEIGCGLGLSSIVLHKMGVDITASDYHPLAKSFLDENIINNELMPIKFESANWDVENPLLGEFDLIIGSDVLYEPAHVKRVSDFIDCHSAVNVEVIIVDPGRSNRSNFTRAMMDLGYAHQYETFDVAGLNDDHCKGRVLSFQR